MAPNDAALRTLGRKFGFYTGYTVCQAGEDGCIYPTDGTTDDFAYGDLGVAAYTFELGNWFFEDCSTFTSSIIDPVLTSLMVAAKAARQPYRTPAGPEVIQASVTPTQVLAGGQVTLTVAIDSARYATNDPDFGIEPVQPITAAHFTVDAPGWISGTVAYSLTVVPTAPDGLQATASAVIDTAGWATGCHLVLTEAQDAGGEWGAPTAVYLRVLPPDSVAGPCPAAPTPGPDPGDQQLHYLPFVVNK